jgi:hypothetical protein
MVLGPADAYVNARGFPLTGPAGLPPPLVHEYPPVEPLPVAVTVWPTAACTGTAEHDGGGQALLGGGVAVQEQLLWMTPLLRIPHAFGADWQDEPCGGLQAGADGEHHPFGPLLSSPPPPCLSYPLLHSKSLAQFRTVQLPHPPQLPLLLRLPRPLSVR